uniref:N-acetyltransferase domain-containing protein n=1 Tax=Oryza glumipatula TaxID=40148 RepID=A0A0E0AF77_9ORYZ
MVVACLPEDGGEVVLVREFDGGRDRPGVEQVERACEVGPSGGKLCLFTDLLGDPLCRVRHSPAYLMLVAEAVGGPLGTEIVGVVRGCVKTVACGRSQLFSKVAYLLGLRVSPRHRRRGIGRKLVERMEEWFREMGAEYAYVATDRDNEPSVRLFTGACGYAKFRTPSVLVHPVFGHDLAPSRRAAVVRLDAREAELLYRRRLGSVEFFPRDIDAVGACEPLRAGVPHWPRLGADDLWCIKRLADGYGDGALGDWSKAPPGTSIFVDPREF